MRVLCLATVLAACVAAGIPPTASAHRQLHRGCTNTLLGHYYVGVGHHTCRFAIRSSRRMIRGGRKPRGWRCETYANRLFGTCVKGGRIFHWAGAE